MFTLFTLLMGLFFFLLFFLCGYWSGAAYSRIQNRDKHKIHSIFKSHGGNNSTFVLTKLTDVWWATLLPAKELPNGHYPALYPTQGKLYLMVVQLLMLSMVR